MSEPKRKPRKSVIEAFENEFDRAEKIRQLVSMYKAKHGLATKFEAAAAMIEEVAMREGLGL